jgi:radical SAM-linked protein
VRGRTEAPAGFAQAEGTRWRIRFAKVGRGAFISHLDTMRLTIRVFRRARIEMIYSKGFHPKPQLTFAPALGLGVAALGELCDVRIDFSGDAAELAERLRAAAPEGFVVGDVARLDGGDPTVSRVIERADYAAWLPAAPAALATEGLTVTRLQKRVKKTIDVARHLEHAELVADAVEAARLRATLDWPDGGALLRFRLRIGPNGGAKPSEVVTALVGGRPPEGTRYARLALWALRGDGVVDPLDLVAVRTPSPVAVGL